MAAVGAVKECHYGIFVLIGYKSYVHGGSSMLAPPRTQPIVRRKLTYAPGSLELTTLAIYTFRTKLVWMALAAKHELIHGLTFGHENQFAALRAIEKIANPAELAGVSMTPAVICKLIEALTAYASG